MPAQLESLLDSMRSFGWRLFWAVVEAPHLDGLPGTVESDDATRVHRRSGTPTHSTFYYCGGEVREGRMPSPAPGTGALPRTSTAVRSNHGGVVLASCFREFYRQSLQASRIKCGGANLPSAESEALWLYWCGFAIEPSQGRRRRHPDWSLLRGPGLGVQTWR